MREETAEGSAWVGRDDELAAVVEVLRDGRSVVVCGEAGVGKSALVGRALSQAGLDAVTCRCFRSLSQAPAAPLQLGFGEPVPVGDAVWTAQWTARRLRRRVLVVDDLQWADDATREIVGHLLAHVPTAVTIRTGDTASAEALEHVAGPATSHIDLEPLDLDDAARLAAMRHPGLTGAEARALAERTGGLPLLLEELGSTGEASPSLRSATVSRLRRCGAAARRDFSLLVRAGQPLPSAWLEGGLDDLVAARLVSVDDDLVRPRHALLAQVIGEHLVEVADRVDLPSLDRTLADLAAREGRSRLAARMYDLAGDGAQAHRCATAAAAESRRPGERAEMLHLAAVHAGPVESARLSAEAVRALVVAGDFLAAAALSSRLPDQPGAEWRALQGRICWETGDDDGALAAFEAGLRMLDDRADQASQAGRDGEEGEEGDPGGPGDPGVEVALLSDYARAISITGGDLDRALTLAERAVARADATGVDRARAWCALGTVTYFQGRPEHLDHMRAGVGLTADPTTDAGVRFTCVNNLVSALESAGETAEALRIAREFAAQADDLRMRGWAQQLTANALNVLMHRGDYGPVLAEGLPILQAPGQRRTAEQLEITVGIALIDLGRLDEARARLDRARARAIDDSSGRGQLTWLSAEERIWSGRYAEATALAEEAAEVLLGALQLFGSVTLAHARLRAGAGVEGIDEVVAGLAEADLPVVAAIPHEVAGVRALAAGDPAARGHFTTAAGLWEGHHRRGELRCRWLAADAAVREGPEHQAALAELGALEAELDREGWLPLLGAVRRSQRERGVRRAAARGRSGELTLREREVLDLVARGLSTDAIAVRLGLSPATVAAQIASGRARLGAATRWQAATSHG